MVKARKRRQRKRDELRKVEWGKERQIRYEKAGLNKNNRIDTSKEHRDRERERKMEMKKEEHRTQR